MDMDAYQKEAEKTAKYAPYDGVVYNSAQLAAEAGEVVGKVTRLIRRYGMNSTYYKASTPEHSGPIVDELGDVLWHLTLMARDIGSSLSEVAARNVERLADRDRRNVIIGEGDNR